MKTKTCLLLNPPARKKIARDLYCSDYTKGTYYWHPFELLVQSGFLAEQFNIIVIDAIIENLSFSNTLKRLEKESIDYVFSLVGEIVFPNDIKFLEALKKQNNPQYIFVSGDLPHAEPHLVLKNFPSIDGILLDFSSPNLCRFLSDPSPQGIHNELCYRKNGEIFSGHKIQKELFEYPIPHLSYFLSQPYDLPFNEKKRFYSIISSNGCPYQCTFCNVPSIGFNLRKPQNFLEELLHLDRLGVKQFYFRDASFGVSREYSIELCKRIYHTGMDIRWNCFTRADLLDIDILGWMKKAGCFLVQIGVESYSDAFLRNSHKKLTKDCFRETFSLCKSMKMQTSAHCMLGLEDGGPEEAEGLLEFIFELDPDYLACTVLKPRAGSGIRGRNVVSPPEDIEKRHRESEKWIHRKFYLRPRFIWKELKKIRNFTMLKKRVREALVLFFR